MKVFSIVSTRNSEGMHDILGMQFFSYFYPNTRSSRTSCVVGAFINKFYDTKPDFFYFAKSKHLTKDILLKLKSVSPRTKFVMQYNDQRGYVPEIIQDRASVLDVLLINNADKRQFKMYRKFGIKHVFTLHHPVYPNDFSNLNSDLKYDVLFGGNNFGASKFPLSRLRYEFVQKCYRRFQNMVVYGAGWTFKTDKCVFGSDYANALHESKINLGMNHFDVAQYYDKRLFDGLASGRLHITYYIPGMEKDFENGKHLVWFKSISEGMNKIRYFLDNPEMATEIGNFGRQFVLKNHTITNRMARLKTILSGLYIAHVPVHNNRLGKFIATKKHAVVKHKKVDKKNNKPIKKKQHRQVSQGVCKLTNDKSVMGIHDANFYKNRWAFDNAVNRIMNDRHE